MFLKIFITFIFIVGLFFYKENLIFFRAELVNKSNTLHEDNILLSEFFKLDQSPTIHDKLLAFNIILNLANSGMSEAYYHLANYYFSGIGQLNINYENALFWYKKSAEKGDDRSIRMLGYMYDQGYGVSKDINLAKYYYKLSADKGNSDAQIALGSLIYNDSAISNHEKWKQSSNLYYTAANDEFGRGEAFVNLARMSLRGELSSFTSTCSQNATALDYYRKASVSKTSHQHIKPLIIQNIIAIISTSANCNLSANSFEDIFYLKEYLSFLHNGNKLNEFNLPQTNKQARYNSLDLFYLSEQDMLSPSISILLLDEAISYGSLKAYTLKAIYLLYVIKDELQYKRAIEMLYLAAIMGDAEAMYQIGYILNSGTFNLERNYTTAKLFYYGSSQKGNIQAYIKIGDLYRNGIGGLTKDIKKSNDYYLKAAYDQKEPSGEAYFKLASNLFYFNIYRFPPNLSCNWLLDSKKYLNISFKLNAFHSGSLESANKLNKRINLLYSILKC